jgi:hypothetical protein
MVARRGYLSPSPMSHGLMAAPHPPKSAPLRPEKAPWLLEWRFLSLVISFGGRAFTDQGPRSDVFEARWVAVGAWMGWKTWVVGVDQSVRTVFVRELAGQRHSDRESSYISFGPKVCGPNRSAGG